MDATQKHEPERSRWVAPVCTTVSVLAVCGTVAYLAKGSDSARNIRALAAALHAVVA